MGLPNPIETQLKRSCNDETVSVVGLLQVQPNGNVLTWTTKAAMAIMARRPLFSSLVCTDILRSPSGAFSAPRFPVVQQLAVTKDNLMFRMNHLAIAVSKRP